MLINLIISELLISVIGVPIDIIGTLSGTTLSGVLCPTAAFVHTTLGKYISKNSQYFVPFLDHLKNDNLTIINQIVGMSSLFTIVTMAGIRYLSVVRYERKWHIETHEQFWRSRCVQLIWGFSILMSAPPLLGMGKYVADIGTIR